MAIRDLFVLQAGAENSTDTWGTSKVPTVKLMGIQSVSITPIVEAQIFPEVRGSLAPGFEAEIATQSAQATIDGLVTYQDEPYRLQAALGDVTVVNDVGDTDYWDRTYDAPTSIFDSDSRGAGVPYTFVYGDLSTGATSSDTVGMRGATLTSITYNMSNDGPWTFSSSWIGRNVEEDALASLADRDVDVVMGHQTSLAIDTTATAHGTTAISNVAFNASLTLNTNRALKRHLGSLPPTGYRDAAWDASLQLNLELESTSRAYLTSILGAASVFSRNIRISAVNGIYVQQFDFVGTTTAAPETFTDEDGVITVELNFAGHSVVGGNLGNWLQVLNTNQTQTLA